MLLLLLFVCFQNNLTADQGISLTVEYQKNSGLQWDWAIESLEKFSFNSNDKVLDVGCGDGKITALIARQIFQGIVVGMDISEKMIKQASSNFRDENLMFFQGNANAIPFKEQFNKVTSFCTLHWVLDQKNALNSLRDCLKQGGIMLLVLPGKASNNLATISEKIANSEKWSKNFPSFKQERVYFTLNEYEKLLKEVNLEVLSILETESVIFYANKLALIDWIKPLVNFIDHLEPNLQRKFIEDIADQMLLNDPMASDGSIHIHHIKIEVIAKRI
jgi:trans-aconitate 2-methyltransferase